MFILIIYNLLQFFSTKYKKIQKNLKFYAKSCYTETFEKVFKEFLSSEKIKEWLEEYDFERWLYEQIQELATPIIEKRMEEIKKGCIVKLTNNQIINMAEQCSMVEFEHRIFETSIDDLREFAELVIEHYESEDDPVADMYEAESFTAYGKKEDWE